MAWERVYLRRADGSQTGPHPIAHVLAWNEASQIPPDCELVDAGTGQTCALSDYARLPTPTKGYPEPPRSGNAMNKAILACVCGALGVVFSFCCCAISYPLAIGAIGLGSMAIHEAMMGGDSTARAIAIVAILMGGLSLVMPLVFMIPALLS
jgi:hypothetical protein